MQTRSVILGILLVGATALFPSTIYAGDNGAGADLQKADPANSGDKWSGFYVGANGGYSRYDGSKDNLTFDNSKGLSEGPKEGDTTGGIAGGQAGYNAQQGHFVIGIEGEVDKALMYNKGK